MFSFWNIYKQNSQTDRLHLKGELVITAALEVFCINSASNNRLISRHQIVRFFFFHFKIKSPAKGLAATSG